MHLFLHAVQDLQAYTQSIRPICFILVLLNASIGPKPVKRNSNLFDNSTLKVTHSCNHTHTHTQLHSNTLTLSEIAKSRKSFPHKHILNTPDVTENDNVRYHYLLYVYCLRTSLRPVVLSFWQKRISAPCLFIISMIFKLFYFRCQFINR